MGLPCQSYQLHSSLSEIVSLVYKRYFNHRIQMVGDLRFDLNNIDSYELITKHIKKMNFLEWTGLCHSVPVNLRNTYHNPDYTALNPFQN